mmetsp:Transcript_31475/g.56538  ORF Transcript_31475/g.56538 Transcript_31475/m.56538 type:complete len:135 (-) Transcript_31475:103-507(-)
MSLAMILSFALCLALSMMAQAVHYENPYMGGCRSDELPIRITGIPGAICSPHCDDGPCPSDVPKNVTATPQCALRDPTGSQYCALICDPNGKNTCGPGASCRALSPIGLCTYDEVNTHFFRYARMNMTLTKLGK